MAEASGMAYDGKRVGVNTSLSGEDEKVVQESAYGVDVRSVNAILATEATNPNCVIPRVGWDWCSSPEFADPINYFKSKLPLGVLENEFDYVVKRKNVLLSALGLFTIALQLYEIETAYDSENSKYRVGQELGLYIKGAQTLLTLILLYMLYDYYSYQIVGLKKRWYMSLYGGRRPGNLPRGIWSSNLRIPFIVELLICAIHVPPFLDFRYWVIPEGKINVNIGMKKPFLCDNFGVFMVLRLYLLVRVVRDHTTVYQRRRVIYEGGFQARGGQEINFKIACKTHYLQREALSIFSILAVGTVILSYCTWVTERDYQPSIFTYKASFWFTIFQILLVGFNDMQALTQFGQLVSLAVVFFGIVILSLSIAVVFNAMRLSPNEGWALDWLREYILREKERNAATDYLAYWWRYLAVKNATELPPDEKRRLQATYYSQSVQMFNKMSGHNAELAQTTDFGMDSAIEDARKNMKLVTKLKGKLLGKGTDAVADARNALTSHVVVVGNRIEDLEKSANRCLELLSEM